MVIGCWLGVWRSVETADITGPTAGRTWLFLLRCFVNADEHRGVVMAVNFYAADVLKLQSTQQLCAALGGTCTKRSAADPEAVAVPHSEVAVIFGRAKSRLVIKTAKAAVLLDRHHGSGHGIMAWEGGEKSGQKPKRDRKSPSPSNHGSYNKSRFTVCGGCSNWV